MQFKAKRFYLIDYRDKRSDVGQTHLSGEQNADKISTDIPSKKLNAFSSFHSIVYLNNIYLVFRTIFSYFYLQLMIMEMTIGEHCQTWQFTSIAEDLEENYQR